MPTIQIIVQFLSGNFCPPQGKLPRCGVSVLFKGRKKHINFFNINLLPPTQNPPVGLPAKSLCASFPGKERKKGAHVNFFGGILGQKGVPIQTIFGHKKLAYCFFRALIFTVFEFLSHLPGNSRASRGRKFRLFLSFCVFGVHKLLRACLKAPALTGYVGDAQHVHAQLHKPRQNCSPCAPAGARR